MTCRQIWFAALTVLCLVGTRPATSQTESGWQPLPDGTGTVRCESPHEGRKYCEVPNIDAGSARVYAKLSDTDCHRGQNWDADSRGVWVDNGCGAVFSFTYRRDGGGSSSVGAGRLGTVRCESLDDRRKHCEVPNIDTGSVTMERKLSETNCHRGQNWDVDSRGIWVDNGCRAVFAYAHRRDGGGSSSGGSGRLGTVRCESLDDRRRHCEVPNIDPGSVTMDRKLSETNCYRGQDWGADSRGVWVDNGCRAEFGYVTRNWGSSGGGGGASESSMRRACINRASREWAVTTADLEITSAERLQNGGYRFNVQSKRTAGVCMVDRAGNVYRLDTR